MTLEILIDGLSRQLRQVELYQQETQCKRIEIVETVSVASWQVTNAHLDEDPLVG